MPFTDITQFVVTLSEFVIYPLLHIIYVAPATRWS